MQAKIKYILQVIGCRHCGELISVALTSPLELTARAPERFRTGPSTSQVPTLKVHLIERAINDCTSPRVKTAGTLKRARIPLKTQLRGHPFGGSFDRKITLLMSISTQSPISERFINSRWMSFNQLVEGSTPSPRILR